MKPTEINADLENHLIKIVKEYAIKMNEIENQISDLQDKDTEGKIDCFAEFKKLYDPVFQQYATNKKRVYGGQANSFGKPAKYDGIEWGTAGQVKMRSTGKSEVYFKTENDFSAEYLFVLHKEGDDWKIDNVKYKWYNNEKWKPQLM